MEQIKQLQFVELGRKIPTKLIANLIALLLFAVTIYIAAKITWLILEPPATVESQINSESNATISTSQPTKSQGDVSQILSASIFGKASKVAPVEKPDNEVVTDAPKTQLNITLTGVVAVSESDAEGAAIIESQGQQATYVLNDKIMGTNAVLKQILPDRVIMKVGANHETLMLDGFDYSPYVAQETKKSKSKPKKTGPTREQKLLETPPIRLDKRHDKTLAGALQKSLNEFKQNPDSLFDLIRISPERRDGDIVGYRLRPGKKPEFFHRAGLKTNDLAIALNGIPLNDMQQSMTIIKELRSLSEASIIVERNGEPIEVLLSIE
ncbi:type II secretion system protein GspC [Flocculibacter collagenilyticus]|uniref:type II secretion system protein GspC n=1 Tax=Flocculibacter collagenilyticus TaxID=2744479 RepID=UPI0018F7B5D8|nr:type II secretion system protein GspC [Flocculibacter collagenilyticus]